jgi:hypothetical protein
MKLADLFGKGTATTVDGGKPLSNVFTDKNVNKKKKKMHKIAKGVYGIGPGCGANCSGDSLEGVGGDAGGGDGGGGGGE